MFRYYGISPVLIVAFGSSVFGCSTSIPGLKEWADQNIGRPISELRDLDESPGSYASRIQWAEKTYPLENGHWVYVHPDRIGCEIHFEVGADGNVVGYRPVGEGCPKQ